MGYAEYFENMSPAQKMFNWTFSVTLPQMHIYSERELEIYGTVSSGDPHYDRALGLEPVVMPAVTIARMLEWWKQGLRNEIVLLHPATDAPVIFRIIQGVLDSWYRDTAQNPGMREVPIEDLQNMDDFGKHVYEIAKWHLGKDVTNFNPLEQDLVDSISPLAPVDDIRQRIDDSYINRPYRSALDDIVALVSKSKRNWRE